ncbi:hypothetical protein ASPCAL10432 [Aspergillus calidoustus]|jgi:hypothetical protein|uniref:Uncharacterized protein n=1 Tax=Aspergillus calidoustus TaxID=454130 RepID=A0A0U4ZBN6_ASPCI|nr:hypothetical protein ASPCAL10432 [Aspergillus calidoustus]
MAIPTLTPNQSPDSSEDKDDTITWEHIESAGAPMVRQPTLDVLSDAFARLHITPDLDREFQLPPVEGGYPTTSGSSDDEPLQLSVTIAPVIKVTSPEGVEGAYTGSSTPDR